jgi:hypothetical protein
LHVHRNIGFAFHRFWSIDSSEAMSAISGTVPGALPGALPITPSKNIQANIAVERVIHKLNHDYALGVTIPDSSLSPVKRKQLGANDDQFARCDRICSGIRFLFYQRGDTLDRALDSFFHEAKAASLRWVPKPRADPGTLPSATAPPKAQTPAQRLNLQSILIGVIDGFKAQKMPPLQLPRPNDRIGNAGRAPPLTSSDESDAGSPRSFPESPVSTGSKRSFDSDDDHAGKRPRGLSPCPSPTPSAFTEALDKVPTRQRLGGPAENQSPERRRPGAPRSNSSDTPVSSRVSSVFSGRGGQQSTQTTLDGDSRQEKPFSPPHPPSQPFTVADRTSPAVNRPPSQESISRPAHQLPQQSSAAYSEVEFPDSTPLPQDAILGRDRRDGFDSVLTNGQLTPLQSRLQNIWRKWTNSLGSGMAFSDMA